MQVKIILIVLSSLILFAGCHSVNSVSRRETGGLCVAEAIPKSWRLSERSGDFSAGGVDLRDMKVFSAEIDGCTRNPLTIPEHATAVDLTGAVHTLEKDTYENVVAINWYLICSAHDCRGQKNGCTDNEIVDKTLSLLSCFPNVQYLTISLCGTSATPLLTVPLERLQNLKKLGHLTIEGLGFVVTGMNEALPRMKRLRTLAINGTSEWSSWDLEDDFSGAVVVPSLRWQQESSFEVLDLKGAVLLEADSPLAMKHLKVFTPPLFYALKHVPSSIEELDTTQSDPPLDGFGHLSELKRLRKIIVCKADEVDVRRVLESRQVEIVVVPDNRIGRSR